MNSPKKSAHIGKLSLPYAKGKKAPTYRYQQELGWVERR